MSESRRSTVQPFNGRLFPIAPVAGARSPAALNVDRSIYVELACAVSSHRAVTFPVIEEAS